MLVYIGDAEAQDLAQYFHLERPGHLTLRLFGAGYGAEKYGTTHEGFELNQTITHEVSFIGRAIAYQIYKGTGFDSPLTPSPHSATRNFGRFEGGVSLTPFQGTTFAFLGGEDVGDSDAPMFENDFSSWIRLQSRHPVNVAYSTSHYFENGVTNGLIDLRTVGFSTGRWMLLIGGRRDLGRRHSRSSEGAGRSGRRAFFPRVAREYRSAGRLRELAHIRHVEPVAKLRLGRIALIRKR
jgi:hypothetical protein